MESEKNNSIQLVESAGRGNLEAVKSLVEKEKVDIQSIGNYGYSALHEGAEHRHTEVVQYLVMKGANVNAEAHSTHPVTPLFCSIFNGYVDIARLLIQHGANTGITLRGRNFLEKAIASNKPTMIELALESGFAINQCASFGLPPISYVYS